MTTAPRTLIDIASNLIHNAPDRLALVPLVPEKPPQSVTHGEYFERAAGYAAYFREAGLKPGELVILIQQPGPEVMYAFWGAMLLGAIPSIFPFLTEKLDVEYYGVMVRKMAATSRPAMIATYPEFYATLSKIVEGVEGLRAVVCADSPRRDDPLPWIKDYRGEDRQVAFLQHSSGTTGLQKGITFSHRAMLQYLHKATAAMGITQDDVFVSWLPLYHDMGLIAGFMLPCLNGLPIVLMSPFHWVRDPKIMLRAFHEFRGTLCWMPNFALNFMAMRINSADLAGLDLSSWRLLVNASEPVRAASNQLFTKAFEPFGFREQALGVAWGTAENIMAITYTTLGQSPRLDYVDRQVLSEQRLAQPLAADDPRSAAQVSCGEAMPGVEIRIVDESQQDLPERHVGDVLVRNEFMFSGYYNRPDLTELAFRDGWFITGDMGYLADGELYITGRKKDLIIVGGKNIYPQDIEEIAGGVSGVKGGRAVAFGVFNENLGTEDIYLICEVTASQPDERRRVELEIRERLSRQADVTARRVILKHQGWLVKTTSGKMARAANREKYLNELKA
jgi:fatty-acyl-CoA synthase